MSLVFQPTMVTIDLVTCPEVVWSFPTISLSQSLALDCTLYCYELLTMYMQCCESHTCVVGCTVEELDVAYVHTNVVDIVGYMLSAHLTQS